MKKQKGITLIALIITIIVMLILVGVTINVALNGGLFDTANKATNNTEKHSIYDQLLGVMKITDNGTINVEETHSNAETVLENKGMTVSELGADGNFTVTGKRGTYTYKITETEIIIDPEEISNVWIERGLSPNYQFGKWYGNSEDNALTKFLKFNEDGSYSQYNTDTNNTMEMSSEQIDQMINQGAGIVDDIDFIAVNQWMIRLNTDGTLTHYNYNTQTENYEESDTILYVVEE